MASAMPLLEIVDLRKGYRAPDGETQAVIHVPVRRGQGFGCWQKRRHSKSPERAVCAGLALPFPIRHLMRPQARPKGFPAILAINPYWILRFSIIYRCCFRVGSGHSLNFQDRNLR